MWGAVGQWLLNKYCLKEQDTSVVSLQMVQAENGNLSKAEPNESMPVRHKVTPVRKKATPTITQEPSLINTLPEEKYVTIIESEIEKPKAATTGGWKALAILFITLFLFSFVINVHFFFDSSDLKSEYSMLEKKHSMLASEIIDIKNERNTLKHQINTLENEISFYDRHVVFVEDDGTKLYHKYDCSKFVADSFWAYNVEAAEGKGFKPCPRCHPLLPDTRILLG